MKKLRKKLVLLIFLIFALTGTSITFAQDTLLEPADNVNSETGKNKINYFDLSNIAATVLNGNNIISRPDAISYSPDKKTKARSDFIKTTLKFNQGNTSVAYDEYEKLIAEVDSDTALLSLAEVFYKIGYFTLAQRALDKIVYENQYYDNIADLEKSYKPKAELLQEDEIYLGRLYSDIYFNNSAQEVINELVQKRKLFKTNDSVDFILARAFYQNKEINEAMRYLDKAISINPGNISYKMFKLEILVGTKKYKEAYKYSEKLKKVKIPINFVNEYNVLNAEILANVSSSESEKKYYASKKSFIEGNYEKTKKGCQNILNFDKDNDKILTLYAKSVLALGKVERANTYFNDSYKINKKNPETLIGLGDIKYMHGDYKSAVKTYKKAYRKDKNNFETVIKLVAAHKQYGKKHRELNKFEQILDKMPSSEYVNYYTSAISIAQKDDVLKEEFLKRALNINPLDEKAAGELVKLNIKNKNFDVAKNLIFNTSFTLEKNYFYYYLCGLYYQAINKKKEAVQNYKTCLRLNQSFEAASVMLLNLIPETTANEEI